MSTEWTRLNLLEAMDFDTPELVAARKACNDEIRWILAERERIATAKDAVNSISIEDVSVEQMMAGQQAKADTFRLLQRELKLRNTLLKDFILQEIEVAGKAGDIVDRQMAEIEKAIIKDLEKIGYQARSGDYDQAGEWTVSMVRNHPRHVAARGRIQHLRGYAGNYETHRENATFADAVQTALHHAKAALVG